MNFALFQEHLCATRYLSFCGVDTLVVKQEKRTERMVASEDKINFENCVKIVYESSKLGNFLGGLDFN